MSDVTTPVLTEKKPDILKTDLKNVPELLPTAEQKDGKLEGQKPEPVAETETKKKEEEAKGL
jgi:hypothetical protein